jgi:GT2 family glycosyltransferase
MATPSRAVGRNDPCPCGSGKRYKQCCGAVGGPVSQALDVQQTLAAALAAQQARRLDEAEALYRQVLGHVPDLADALHMLGVIRYERRDYAEARALITRALDLTDWRFDGYRHNLGLVVSRANAADVVDADAMHRQQRYRAAMAAKARIRDVRPRVAVVVPAYNHERYIVEALESVYAQTYRDIELIVVDDCSTDATADRARRSLAHAPFPHRLQVRPNRGAAATIDEGIALASAPFVNVLNSDDAFDARRIETMVAEVAARGEQWGFSGIDVIDDAGRDVDTLQDARAYALACAISAVPFGRSTGFALLAFNVVVSTGNLFFARGLWQSLGGFAELRYNHDWDFALRALWESEPRFVADPLYRYRLHARNTIAESATAPREEAQAIMRRYLARAASLETPRNPHAPSVQAWGPDFAVAALQGGLGETMDVPLLQSLVAIVESQRHEEGADAEA